MNIIAVILAVLVIQNVSARYVRPPTKPVQCEDIDNSPLACFIGDPLLTIGSTGCPEWACQSGSNCRNIDNDPFTCFIGPRVKVLGDDKCPTWGCGNAYCRNIDNDAFSCFIGPRIQVINARGCPQWACQSTYPSIET